MTIGSLGFLNPAILLALLALPAIWWLLRATPPQPERIRFPAVRILKGIKSNEQTPARSPWWLTLIRMLAAAAIILALAGPVLNPDEATIAGEGPVIVLVDDGWAASAHWPERKAMLDLVLAEAADQGRAVMLVPAAGLQSNEQPVLESAKSARDRAEALEPKPYPPRRAVALDAAQKALGGETTASILWLSDGLDHGDTAATGEKLTQLAGAKGKVIVVEPAAATRALGLRIKPGNSSALEAEILRAGGTPREGVVVALSGRGQPLGEARFSLEAGSALASARFELPLELRNQVTRIEIAGESSAGAVHLLDASKRWNRIGLASGSTRGEVQQLLSPLHYIERALVAQSDLVRDNDVSTADAISRLLGQGVSVLMLADIGNLTGSSLERVGTWVDKGGILVRFAGPRLEQGGDDLLPVALRVGGRTLGGAMSWSVPQPMQPFEASSPFAGLLVPDEVRINRQVLADPTLMSDATEVWARLADGTPLVTAARRGSGYLVLFHVTGNSDWSNLPLSGLFVEMLQRVVALTGLADVARTGDAAAVAGESAPAGDQTLLPPVETLDGFGRIGVPPPTVRALAAIEAKLARPDPVHPPGLYGPPGKVVAINIIDGQSKLTPLGGLPAAAIRTGYRASAAEPVKWLALVAALGLLLADVIAVLALQTGFLTRRTAAAAAALVAFLAVPLLATTEHVLAQQDAAAPVKPPGQVDDRFALEAALKPRLAYVLTGDPETDETSRLGLNGLGLMLLARTAFEPAEPTGVDIEKDELAFFPVIYWPVTPEAREPSEQALGRIDAYMKGGGLILFDTRDVEDGATSPEGSGGPGMAALRRLVGKLDIPLLEPVPPDHVLTKSFYLLKTFPGRFDGGQLWVEAEEGSGSSDARRPRHSDGVSSLLITSNDLAGAWAIDEQGRPLFPVIPGGEDQREWAYRTGVNIVMYALTGNYKADQVHVPALLERLGQ
jgi:hypothetical protein